MLVFVNQTYSPTMSEIEIYVCVRQFWFGVAASRRTRHESGRLLYPIAVGIADGVVLRAYSIAEWLPGGDHIVDATAWRRESRWEFVGQVLSGHPLVGRRLVDGDSEVMATQQGYRYIN
jgi:hypothetical protein